tara:strand:+ start:598 stop:1002 length:405 start_codon:yes stop_codon:yes gene_type:complete
MTSICFHNQSVELNRLWYESHKALIMNLCIEFGAMNRLEELSKKFLGQQLKIKKVRPLGQPKRTRSAFFFFCNDRRPVVMETYKKAHNKVNVGEVSKILGAEWQALDASVREKYTEMNKIDKQRYQEEMAAWKK